jgi:hypothetical protein
MTTRSSYRFPAELPQRQRAADGPGKSSGKTLKMLV